MSWGLAVDLQLCTKQCSCPKQGRTSTAYSWVTETRVWPDFHSLSSCCKNPQLSKVTCSLSSCLSQGWQLCISRMLSPALCLGVKWTRELGGTAPFLLISQPGLSRGDKLLQKLYLLKCSIYSKASTHSLLHRMHLLGFLDYYKEQVFFSCALGGEAGPQHRLGLCWAKPKALKRWSGRLEKYCALGSVCLWRAGELRTATWAGQHTELHGTEQKGSRQVSLFQEWRCTTAVLSWSFPGGPSPGQGVCGGPSLQDSWELEENIPVLQTEVEQQKSQSLLKRLVLSPGLMAHV